MNIYKLIYRFSWFLLVILALIGLLFIFTPKLNKYSKLQNTRNNLEDNNCAKTAEIKDFKIKQERFTTEPKFVERTAREAGMVAPDEVVYKFKDANGKVP